MKLLEIQDLLSEIEGHHSEIIQAQGSSRRFIKANTITQAKMEITKKANQLQYKLDILKLKHGEELKISKPEIGQDELDEIDEL